jgi:hypothetical protein
MNTARIIKATGEIVEVEPANGTDFSLEEMQKFVGGYIEVAYPHPYDGMIMVIDEEGKIKQKPINKVATLIYNNTSDVIVGDALLCRSEQVK